MKIQTAATKIISMWEHGGRYDAHGNGAYGLIGWQGGNLINLLKAYQQGGGRLGFNPESYINWPELNELADDPYMQQVQREQAEVYMTVAIRHQQKFYPFIMPLSQLVLCDMGVNNGIYHHYVEHCGQVLSGPNRAFERGIIIAAQKYRIKVMKDDGIWDKYEGIRRRYTWYLDMLKTHSDLNMAVMQPTVMVNGSKVDLGGDTIVPVNP